MATGKINVSGRGVPHDLITIATFISLAITSGFLKGIYGTVKELLLKRNTNEPASNTLAKAQCAFFMLWNVNDDRFGNGFAAGRLPGNIN